MAVGVGVLFCAFADLARRLGKNVEQSLFKETNGRPAMTLLRHRDSKFDAKTKDRYRNLLANRLGEVAPTQGEEEKDPRVADAFYERCGNWLREHTRVWRDNQDESGAPIKMRRSGRMVDDCGWPRVLQAD